MDPVAAQYYTLGWKVNNDCLVAESSEPFSVINLLDLSTAFDVDRSLVFLLPPLVFLFLSLSRCLAWLDPEPSSHLEHYLQNF